MLNGLVDLMDDEAGLPDLMADAADLRDPADMLGLLAKASPKVRERCGDIVAMLNSGAAVAPHIDATRAEGDRRNRLGVEMSSTARSTGRDVDPRAADIAVAPVSLGVYESLVVDAAGRMTSTRTGSGACSSPPCCPEPDSRGGPAAGSLTTRAGGPVTALRIDKGRRDGTVTHWVARAQPGRNERWGTT
ncbi:hypothetical protein [Actinomadura miaoliensis]|uniref:DUF222 domain-containing protein n=1 Tax=Actinomadura miaoliensis TaxID=430685 RepID=A0ABP7VK76_9ACTN